MDDESGESMEPMEEVNKWVAAECPVRVDVAGGWFPVVQLAIGSPGKAGGPGTQNVDLNWH